MAAELCVPQGVEMAHGRTCPGVQRLDTRLSLFLLPSIMLMYSHVWTRVPLGVREKYTFLLGCKGCICHSTENIMINLLTAGTEYIRFLLLFFTTTLSTTFYTCQR